MIPFIRTDFVFVLAICCNQLVMAGKLAKSPMPSFPPGFFLSVERLDSALETSACEAKPAHKICSCQILNVHSNNDQYQDVAVFAEKSNIGDYSYNIDIANRTLEKERRHLKYFFYDKLKLVQQVDEATDCRSLFVKLKLQNHSLQLYDILDADISRK